MKKTAKILLIMDFIAIFCLFITYGPISYFRDLLVTTAMTTMEHQYLAQTFYTEKMIANILKNNVIDDNGKSSDISQIIFNNKPNTTYESIYEERILKKDGNDNYKVIPISGSGYKGSLVAIYQPKKIKLVMASNYGLVGEELDVIVKNNKAILGMNASGFEDTNGVGNGGIVAGILIKDSSIINSVPNLSHGGGIVGFNKEGILMMTHKSAYEAIKDGMVDGVQFGPFLVVNGEASEISGNGGMGIHPRTAIAQRKDGIVLFLTIDGRQPGYSIGTTISEVTKILLKYGAYNASNLDGGASTTLAIDNKIYNKPCGMSNGAFVPRALPNAWILK